MYIFFFFSSRRRHTRCSRDWSSDVCSSDLKNASINLLECAHTKSLDLKLLRMNTYKKCGVSPLLAFERLRPRGREAKKRGRKGGKGDGGSKDRRELSTRNAAQCCAGRARWC